MARRWQCDEMVGTTPHPTDGRRIPMSRSWAAMLGGLALASLMALALPTYPVRAAGDDDVLAKVQSAKTAADHEAIAKIYDARAAAATKEAADHRRMGEAYKGLSGTATGKGYATSAMPQHCEALAKAYDAEAENFKAMAQTHRDLAKAAK
jgi:hypothetical protein